MPKAERLLALAREKYEPRRAIRWPYLVRGDERFRFKGPDRRRLLADLRAAWRGEYPGEATPAARDLSAVADDLRLLAEQAEPDQPTAEDQAAELMEAHGISAVPADPGAALSWRARTSVRGSADHGGAVDRKFEHHDAATNPR
jgi:hypothetical protein